MEEVKSNRYVLDCIGTRPLIIETLTFLCDLGTISLKTEEVILNLCKLI